MSYQQYPTNGQPSNGGRPPRKQSPWSSTPVIVAIIAGVILLVGGVVGALVYAKGKDSTVTAESTSPPVGPSTVTVAPTGDTPQPPQPTQTYPTDTPTPTTPGSGPVTVSDADRQGFLSGPRCNASGDDAVFIGYTSRSHVVICQVGTQTGRYYYKGLADGKTIEIDYPTRSGDTFVATNGGVQYIVSRSSLTIEQNGSVLSQETMLDSWVD